MLIDGEELGGGRTEKEENTKKENLLLWANLVLFVEIYWSEWKTKRCLEERP